jgi:hypothetical protein
MSAWLWTIFIFLMYGCRLFLFALCMVAYYLYLAYVWLFFDDIHA